MRSVLITCHVVSLVLGIAACQRGGPGFRGPNSVQFRQDLSGERGAPVDPSQVAVYLASGPLPEGVKVNERGSVALEPEFPTSKDPHRAIGDVYTGAELTADDDPIQVIPLLTAEAAKWGANALVIETCVPRERCSGKALVLSRVKAIVEYPTLATLQEGPPVQVTHGTDFDRSFKARSLSKIESMTLETRRGRCYGVDLAIEKDAELNGRARRSLYVTVTGGDEGSRTIILENDIPRARRLFSKSLGCPQSDGSMTIEFKVAGSGDEPAGAAADLGRGDASVALYSWPIGETELSERAQEAEARAQRAEARAQESKEKESRIREICNLCRRAYDVCVKNTRDITGCQDRERDCLRIHENVSPASCPL